MKVTCMIYLPLIIYNDFFAVLKSFENIPSILEMLGNLRVIRKSLMKNWESSEVFGLVNSWAVWPLTTIFCVPGVFLAVSRVFGGIMGCSRGVPGLFRAVPGMFRGCSGFYRHPEASCHFTTNMTITNDNYKCASYIICHCAPKWRILMA